MRMHRFAERIGVRVMAQVQGGVRKVAERVLGVPLTGWRIDEYAEAVVVRGAPLPDDLRSALVNHTRSRLSDARPDPVVASRIGAVLLVATPAVRLMLREALSIRGDLPAELRNTK